MKHMHRCTAVAAGVLGLLAAIPAGAAGASTEPAYRLTKTVSLGAPDSWDYVIVDAPSNRVFVAHGDRVTVVDAREGTVIGNVEGLTGGARGIAISSADNRGYMDDGRAGIVRSFDLKTLQAGKTIKADAGADAVVRDSSSGNIFVMNGGAGNVSVIDPKLDDKVATIEIGGKIEYAAADGKGKLFVNGEAKNEIVRIDTRTNQVDARWPIEKCESPHGLAIDPSTRRLFSSCANSLLAVIDADTGATVATVAIGKGSDGVAFDAKRKLILSSNGTDGTLSVIHAKDAKTYLPLATVKTTVTARTIGIHPETGRVYLAAVDQDPNNVAPNGKKLPVPGSLKLLILDPAN